MSTRPILAGVACLALLFPLAAAALETKARSAQMIDHATGMVLLEKNAQEPLPTASMSKLMTLYMLFEAIRDGRVTTETEFRVSPRAQAMGGSRMFVEAGTMVPVDALIHGIIVQSGNDACVVVAENLAGTEEEFARQMTVRAKEIGLTHTSLKNSSGWPEPGHEMSAEDLVNLASRIITEFPEYYAYFAQTEYTWNNITQRNRNPLLTLGIGADGLKTGHTSEAGYGLVGSAVQNGQRIVFVLTGLDNVSGRAAEAEAMVNWAFNAFDTVKFYNRGDEAAVADVWLGQERTVPLVAPQDIQMLVPRTERSAMTARIVYNNPIEAPIQAGQVAGALYVTVPGRKELRFDLVAARDIARGGLMTRIEAAAMLTRDRAVSLITGSD
jgi:serine-type D-Ala-D-Ala carboxypeptidase (penicillin-binding protein 5/6)